MYNPYEPFGVAERDPPSGHNHIFKGFHMPI